jgi:putative transposase
MRKAYTTDLSDAEWNYIEPHLPAPKGHGRPRIHDLREILNAVFYALRSGCQWRLLPHDFPRWPTVYWYFRKWRLERGHLGARQSSPQRKRLRVRLKRDPKPSAGVADSQSLKSTAVGAEERGFDGAKKVKGRKRHLLVDTEGFVLSRRRYTVQRLWTLRGHQDAAEQGERVLSPPLSSVVGGGLPRRGQRGGLG